MFHDEKLYVLALRFCSLDLSSVSGCTFGFQGLSMSHTAPTFLQILEVDQSMGLTVACGAWSRAFE
jgi:hypothetical protein